MPKQMQVDERLDQMCGPDWSRGLGTAPTAKAPVAPSRPSDELLRKWYSEDYMVSVL